MASWTGEQLTRETMVRQGLAARRSIGVVDAVRSLVALQAQEPAAPYLALWNRVDAFDPAELDRAFVDGDIVKSSLFRITLHAIATDDHPWARGAMAPRLRAARYHDRRFGETGLTFEDADAAQERLSARLDRPMSNSEIEALLAELSPTPNPARLWWALRTAGPFRHAPTDDTWSFGRRPRHLPHDSDAADEPAALTELIRRYLAAFGPATVADISQFTLIQRAALRAVLDELGDIVVVHGTLLDVAGREPSAEVSLPPRLLGMWDNLLLAYADRSRVIPDEHRHHVIRRNGDVLPTALVEGRVAGVWRAVEDAIELRPLSHVSDAALEGLDAEAAHLRTFLASREPLVFSRFGRWWDRLPDGPTIRLGA